MILLCSENVNSRDWFPCDKIGLSIPPLFKVEIKTLSCLITHWSTEGSTKWDRHSEFHTGNSQDYFHPVIWNTGNWFWALLWCEGRVFCWPKMALGIGSPGAPYLVAKGFCLAPRSLLWHHCVGDVAGITLPSSLNSMVKNQRGCPKARESPCNIPNVLTTFPGDVITMSRFQG